MTKKNTITIPASGTEQFIPLNRLKKSPHNARKSPHPAEAIEALAASISVHVMLQSPVVEPEQDEDGKVTGNYLVTIGEGRRFEHLLRVKRKEITKSAPVRCVLDTAHNAQRSALPRT
jgi:ParB family chromosome partitioning protein